MLERIEAGRATATRLIEMGSSEPANHDGTRVEPGAWRQEVA